MTLYKQLLLFTISLFLLLFLGVWFEKLQSTRAFLVDQLESHAQDTATSLGLSLSPVLTESDTVTAETMINAVFDRGYYRVIRFTDVDEKVVVERVQVVKYAGVPDFFVRLVKIQGPAAESLIMAGWTQAGSLYVESHPGYAYRTLWETAVRVSVYFFIAGLTVILVGGTILRLLLKPLKRVEQQAEAICRREFTVQESIPRTQELKSVVESMNRMTSWVRDMFTEQSKAAERLRKNAYSDPLTEVGNRRYLLAQGEASLGGSDKVIRGTLILVQIQNLQQINEKKGLEAGDTILRRASDILRECTAELHPVTLARISGSDFALLVLEIDFAEAEELVTTISNNLARLALEEAGVSNNISGIGAVFFTQHQPLPELLAIADTALRKAAAKEDNSWELLSQNQELAGAAKGKMWWRTKLDEVLSNGELLLFKQAVVAPRDQTEILHVEILSRISIAKEEYARAEFFIPLAERTRMIAKLDKLVMEQVLKLPLESVNIRTLAVNLSPSSLANAEFHDWLLDQLERNTPDSFKYIFEFAEFGAIRYLDTLKKFAARVQQLGHGVGLDHFGQSFTSFGYLQSLRPEYVKVDRAYTMELEKGTSDAHFYISSLCGVAHSLGIRVVAEGVERSDQVQQLLDLSFDGIQGYLIDKPGKISMK